MDDLVAFVEARLAEDERVARAAGADHWEVEHRSDWRTGDASTLDPDCAGGRCDCCVIEGADGMRIYDEGGHDSDDAAHIARYDPSRVLREVKAKRRQLAALAARPHFLDNREWYGCRAIDEDDQLTGAACSCGRDGDVALHLRLMAAVWSEHPGFRPEWNTEEER